MDSMKGMKTAFNFAFGFYFTYIILFRFSASVELEYEFFADRSWGTDSGVSSLVFTSTPIKQVARTQPILPPDEAFGSHIKQLDVRPSIIMNELEENLNQITVSVDDEFQSKYSQWIAEVFHLHAVKLKRRLLAECQIHLSGIQHEDQNKIKEMQQSYLIKFNEYELAISHLRQRLSILEAENNKMRAAKKEILLEVQKSLEDAQKNFSVEVERHVELAKADCEKEKSDLQSKHVSQIHRILEYNDHKSLKSVSSINGNSILKVGACIKVYMEIAPTNYTQQNKSVRTFSNTFILLPWFYRRRMKCLKLVYES